MENKTSGAASKPANILVDDRGVAYGHLVEPKPIDPITEEQRQAAVNSIRPACCANDKWLMIAPDGGIYTSPTYAPKLEDCDQVAGWIFIRLGGKAKVRRFTAVCKLLTEDGYKWQRHPSNGDLLRPPPSSTCRTS